jgi:hypothetical protein
MKRLRDFQCCACEAMYERFVSDEVKDMICDCGESAFPVITRATIKLEGITGAFPGAHDRWARIREDNARIKARRNQ